MQTEIASVLSEASVSRRQAVEYSLDRLTSADRVRVLAHFQTLSADDLALRFSAIATVESIVRYVGQIDFDRDIVLGVRDSAGAIVGIVQLMLLASDREPSAEIAFSVAPSARGRGLGHRLMSATIEFARSRGLVRLLAQVCPGNAAMLAVLRRAGMRLRRDDGEIVGVLQLASVAEESLSAVSI